MSKLPDGWNYSEIGKLARVGNGSTPSRKEPRYWDNGTYPWLPTGKVNDRIIKDADQFITQDALDECPVRMYPINSVLVAMIGQGKTRGMVAYLAIPAAINQNFACIIPQKELDNLYLFYCLDNSYDKLRDISHGSNQGALNCSLIEDFVIPIPPLEEQRKIAAILSTWDEAIGLVEALIGALGRRKQALMQLLLTGEVRFAGFEGAWEEVELGEIAQINAEALTEKTNLDHEYYYVDLSAVDKGTISKPVEKVRFSELPSRARRVLHLGDVIMATVRPNLQGFAVCDFDPIDVICSTGFALISPNELRDSQYIYQNLYSESLNSQIQDLVTGSNYPAINSSDVKKLCIPYSEDFEERIKIGDVLQACDDEVKLLSTLGVKLQEQKRGLMQQLLTGAVRV